jgi:LPS-assembly protein
MTALHWQGFSVTPYFSIRETEYGASLDPNGKVISNDILRSSREFGFELVPPSIARVFDSPNWLGKKLKHVIEPRASFRTVNGVGEDFRRLVRFDETELVSNTTEAEISLTNRLYVKRKDDRVDEVLSWTIAQRRFFDPNFGGALIPGQRNVLLSSATFTGYSFLFEPRNYSPVSSTLRLQPDGRFGTEWRADYDPLRGHIVNSSVSVDGRLSHYFLSVGHTQVRSIPQLTPNASQLRATLGFGEQNKRGWNSAFTAFYDYRLGILTYATTQVTYNSDCCGLSVQFNRFNVAQRNENQFRIAFAVANIGSFGTLKKQEKLF